MQTLTAQRTKQINQQSIDRSNMFYWQTDRPLTMEECAIIFGQRQQIDNEILCRAVNFTLNETKDYIGTTVARIEGGEQYTVGSVNVNRNFVLSDGRQVVGRFHPLGIRNGYFSAEAVVASQARAHDIPAARPIAVRYAKSTSAVDFVLFEKVPGANMKHWLNDHPEDEVRLVNAVGEVMARIHQIKVEGYGFFDNDEARYRGELKGIHVSYRDHILAALPQNLREIVGAGYVTEAQAAKITKLLTESALTECADPRLIHNDLADWNTIVKDGEVAAAIDWDEAHAGDPIADIACWSLFFPTSRLELLLNGYRKVGDLPTNFAEKLHIYRLRYLVSKLSLRHKKFTYDQSEIMQSLIKVGREALKEESAYFGLT